MIGSNHLFKRMFLLVAVGLLTCTNSGCSYFLLRGFFWDQAIDYSKFWGTTPIIPVSPYWSELIEDTYHYEERYGKVPILPAPEGENAPLFCMDPPSDDEIIRSLPDPVGGGLPFVAETRRDRMQFVVEPIVDALGECRQYPLVGPARLHKCHYKCTAYFKKTIDSFWPIPFHFEDDSMEVVYIDHDHLIQCSSPHSP